MVQWTSIIEKFNENGEKTGWTYIHVSNAVAKEINPGVRKSFRVKGLIDKLSVSQLALIPMGYGDFIIPLNADLRKLLKKKKGNSVTLSLELDTSEYALDSDFMTCLEDEKVAKEFFYTLTASHQKYFSKWIDSAKTIETKSKRIYQAMEGLKLKLGYPEMLKYFKKLKNESL